MIQASLCEKLLVVKFYHELTFDQHAKILLKKVNEKSKVLVLVITCMGLVKKNVNEFLFHLQFNYYLLIRMIHSLFINSRLKYLHETCVRLIYNDKNSPYEELRDKDESSFIHQGLFHDFGDIIIWASNVKSVRKKNFINDILFCSNAKAA